MSPKLDPKDLEISTRLDPKRLQVIGSRPLSANKPIVVLRDFDGIQYVADGNHRAASARDRGTHVEAEFVTDEYKVGNQTAIERVIGIFFMGKERR